MAAADIAETTFEEVDKCHSSAEGENLLHDIGVETANLDPPLYFIPWILLDEVKPSRKCPPLQGNAKSFSACFSNPFPNQTGNAQPDREIGTVLTQFTELSRNFS